MFARNVVSTLHTLASEAGLRMLPHRGNGSMRQWVDAEVAAAAAMRDHLRASGQRAGQCASAFCGTARRCTGSTPRGVCPRHGRLGTFPRHRHGAWTPSPTPVRSVPGLRCLSALANVASVPLGSAASRRLQIEAMKLAFADVYRCVAEPSSMEVTPAQMLDDGDLASHARLIDMNRAQDFGAGDPDTGGTIYRTAADGSGMMVSFIPGNDMGLGSGCVEPTFGIRLKNRGQAFSADRAARNPANLVALGKLPFLAIIPAFLLQNGQPAMLRRDGRHHAATGPSADAGAQGRYSQNPQTACDAPRWCFNAAVAIKVSRQSRTCEPPQGRGCRASGTAWTHAWFLPGFWPWPV